MLRDTTLSRCSRSARMMRFLSKVCLAFFMAAIIVGQCPTMTVAIVVICIPLILDSSSPHAALAGCPGNTSSIAAASFSSRSTLLAKNGKAGGWSRAQPVFPNKIPELQSSHYSRSGPNKGIQRTRPVKTYATHTG